MTEDQHDIAIDLRIFWLRYGKRGNKSWHTKRKKIETVSALRELSERFYYFKNRKPLEIRRMAFDKVKFRRHSLRSHSRCFVCLADAEVRHHIIPLKSGGDNSKRNLVSLCDCCHAKVHPWLGESRKQLRADGLTLRPKWGQDMPGDNPERASAEKA